MAHEAAQRRLKTAVFLGDVDDARRALDDGADVRQVDEFAYSLLNSAVLQGNVDVARLLLDRGADMNQLNRNGYSPLSRAVLQGNVGVARLLLDRGADVRQVDRNGTTPLSAAVRNPRNRVAVARLLLRRGADIFQGPSHFATPLAEARRRRENGEAPADSAAALILEVDDLIRKGLWSREAHYALPEATRARAVELGLVGRLMVRQGRLDRMFNRDGPPPLWWINRVMPFAI